MKSKEELKRFFENGDIPKQEEFWEWQDSYWHKDEKIQNTIPLSGTESDKPVIGNIVILPSSRKDISIGSEKGKITFNTGGFINLRSEDNGTVGQMTIASSTAYLQYYPAVGSEKSIVLNDEGITIRGLQQAGEGNHKQLVIDPTTSNVAFKDLGSIYKVKGSIADLDTLNALNGMIEGDVYNIISTGDNYVYVNNIEATGNAGWDKLSGLQDLSSYATELYVDQKLSYSQSEQITGGQWIDGKPIYKKTVKFDTIPPSGEIDITTYFQDVETIVSNQMFTEWYSMDVAFAGNQYRSKAFITLQPEMVKIEHIPNIDYNYSLIDSFTLTLEYTKRTI